ncbi:hypothetical protein SAMN05444401_2435 [Clostridium amylolyticum]|uniref:Uncharacterized protein n=1 Tax=Clostridium amylolyticum TaxID=1121298 RepID=A0A1M6H9Z9_9CLOT|nr:hypothetical protein [Clostridium amylolyticum]SHJ18943.1 hypothetical protein SAMN05444401_2435 [Clostridium amylolyticum]
MFWMKRYKLKKEKLENEKRLRKLHNQEVRYASIRDKNTNVETLLGKSGYIDIAEDTFSIICNDKVVFTSYINDISGSDLMSLDGMIIYHKNDALGENNELMVYYKYHRKVE